MAFDKEYLQSVHSYMSNLRVPITLEGQHEKIHEYCRLIESIAEVCQVKVSELKERYDEFSSKTCDEFSKMKIERPQIMQESCVSDHGEEYQDPPPQNILQSERKSLPQECDEPNTDNQDNGFSSQGILTGENNGQVPCTLEELLDSKSTPLETDVLLGVQDGINGEPGDENDEAIDDKTVSSKECEDASYKTAYSSQERDFAQLIKIIDEDNEDKFKIVNESCESKSTSLEMDKVDGLCDTYYEMEEGPAVPTNEITESSSEEPEINGVHSSYNVDSNHLNHLKSNQDLQPFAHSLKFIKRKADSISREIRKNDGKALFCKFAPCALANLLLLLTTLQIYFCPVQLIQKLGQISLGTKFVMKILKLLKDEQELNELMKEENEDWEKLMKEVNEDWEQPMKEVLAKLKKTVVMPCTNVLIALQRKRFLTSFVKKEFGVYRKQYFLNTAINEFKMSQHKAGLMIYITAEKSHCVVLIKDKNGEEVNIYDATINEDEVENLENLRSLQILVLTYTNDKNDKIPLIEKEWFMCKEFFCSNNYDEAHKSNISAN
ncbi:uncharacterized protein LOC124459510 isoform X2 [Xenia sp. Carnegie-2017]|uniref:uncharacterized protein LOC124459510 isoform X2 n=1 Tax=Xenia sp. Carnegie-2017 TaxID=2897299 RepID=UPI001F04F843|nr:uncharacterized protein LOC124459510 isoform X2 [Xenia sp. Carnegie-2017]